MIRFAAALVLALGLTLGLGLTHTSAQEPARKPCQEAEYRAFDFWLGSWEVHDPTGKRVGENTIRSLHGGCALHESWVSTGFSGSSLNIFARSTGRWHQTWVDSSGRLLRLEGGLENGSMVLRGTTRDGEGQERLERIVWTPLEDGRVRQVWTASSDGGQTWKAVFDGFYTRRKP